MQVAAGADNQKQYDMHVAAVLVHAWFVTEWFSDYLEATCMLMMPES